MTAQPDRSALLDEAREDEQPKQPVHLTSAVPADPSTDLRLIAVDNTFDSLLTALDRAARKGYMPDAMVEEWEAFDYWPAGAVGASSEQAGANEHDFGSRIEHLEALVRRQQELLMQAREALDYTYTVFGLTPQGKQTLAAIDALEPAEPVKGETL